MHRLVIAVLFLLIAAACSGQPVPGGQRPVIERFTADPATIASGGTSTLSWQVTGATSLSIAPVVRVVTGPSTTVTPTQTTEYTLTATNAQGETTAKTTVTVTSGNGGGGNGGDAAPVHDTIAYATEGGDEIRLVNPDGSSDRRLWAHGQADPQRQYEVYSLAWKPDARQLAFASSHERGCSAFIADIYTLDADGSDYRRLSQGPACAALSAYSKGTVRVPVRNDGFESFSGFLYFQGAPGVQPVNLPPFGTEVVTFADVADLGPGVMQRAVVIAANVRVPLPDAREILQGTAVDVQAGGTVTTAEAQIFIPDAPLESRSPTWRQDGGGVTLAQNFNALLELAPDAGVLGSGSRLLAGSAQMPFLVLHAARGPSAQAANQILHTGWGPGLPVTLHLTEVGAAQVGAPLLSFGTRESVFGLVWLPDGSGFAYTVTEGAYAGGTSGNLFVYTFADGETTPITAFTDAYAGQVAVSPDGQRFAFERSSRFDTATGRLGGRDLWLVNRDGSGLTLLVENAYAPAWSR